MNAVMNASAPGSKQKKMKIIYDKTNKRIVNRVTYQVSRFLWTTTVPINHLDPHYHHHHSVDLYWAFRRPAEGNLKTKILLNWNSIQLK